MLGNVLGYLLGKEALSRPSPTMSKVWVANRPAAGRGLINAWGLRTHRHPALVPPTLRRLIRRLSPAFKESCRFHQEAERSAAQGALDLALTISRGPASLGTQCGAGPQLLVHCSFLPSVFIQAKCIYLFPFQLPKLPMAFNSVSTRFCFDRTGI